MLNRLPDDPGTLAELLEDLGCARLSDERIGAALGVCGRTVRRWRATRAPRMALLALWWLSRDGLRAWDAEAARVCELHRAAARSMWAELRRLREQIAGQMADQDGRDHAEDAQRRPGGSRRWIGGRRLRA